MYYILALVALAAALAAGYALGRARRGNGAAPGAAAAAASPSPPSIVAPAAVAAPALPPAPADDHGGAERARIIRSLESEATGLRRRLADDAAGLTQLADFAADREHLFGDLARARTETARYRQLVIDLENNAPPPLLGGPGAPDDLKLIVGVGPILERMLFALGVTTYRQIARWSERDIDEIDARLHEFPGRIRRDGWVTQARALHQSKYGEPVPARDRG